LPETRNRARELEALFRSSDWRTRLDAVEALRAEGHEGVPALVKAAFSDPHDGVKLVSLLALRDIGRDLKGKRVESEEAKALKIVGKYFTAKEHNHVVAEALQAALRKEVTASTAPALIESLRRAVYLRSKR